MRNIATRYVHGVDVNQPPCRACARGAGRRPCRIMVALGAASVLLYALLFWYSDSLTAIAQACAPGRETLRHRADRDRAGVLAGARDIHRPFLGQPRPAAAEPALGAGMDLSFPELTLVSAAAVRRRLHRRHGERLYRLGRGVHAHAGDDESRRARHRRGGEQYGAQISKGVGRRHQARQVRPGGRQTRHRHGPVRRGRRVRRQGTHDAYPPHLGRHRYRSLCFTRLRGRARHRRRPGAARRRACAPATGRRSDRRHATAGALGAVGTHPRHDDALQLHRQPRGVAAVRGAAGFRHRHAGGLDRRRRFHRRAGDDLRARRTGAHSLGHRTGRRLRHGPWRQPALRLGRVRGHPHGHDHPSPARCSASRSAPSPRPTYARAR